MKRKLISFKVRKAILERDRYRCVICGDTNRNSKLEIDHIIPIVKGGTNDFDNLCTLCLKCNRGKNDDLLRIPIQKNKLQEALEEEEIKKKRNKLEQLREQRNVDNKKEELDIERIKNQAKISVLAPMLIKNYKTPNKFKDRAHYLAQFPEDILKSAISKLKEEHKNNPESLRKLDNYQNKMGDFSNG